jgi:hypothetical protein
LDGLENDLRSRKTEILIEHSQRRGDGNAALRTFERRRLIGCTLGGQDRAVEGSR